MGKLVALILLLAAVAVGLVLVVVVAAGTGLAGSDTSPGAGGVPGSTDPGSAPAIPASWLPLYRQAALTCPGLPWSIVAAVGTVESGSGQSTDPGVASGSNSAGAEGPMQFEPSTFAAYATVGPGGVQPPSPYDPVDAVYSATTMLCADGAGSASTLARRPSRPTTTRTSM